MPRDDAIADDEGYWVIVVDRRTGKATTSKLIRDKNEAWQLSLALEESDKFTTVVARRPGRSNS